MSRSSLSGSEPFDPVAYAERWYEENPRAWATFSQALDRLMREELGEVQGRIVLRRALVSDKQLEGLPDVPEAVGRQGVQHRSGSVLGRKLMEDAEIVEEATKFGNEVRTLEDQGLELERRNKRLEWAEFRNQFRGDQLSLAVESYYVAYLER